MLSLLLQNRPLLIVIIIGALLASAAFVFGIFVVAPDIVNVGQKPTSALSLEMNKYPAVATISPQEYELLTPGRPQEFRVTFRGNGDVTTLRASVSQALIRKPGTVTTVPVTTSFDQAKKAVIVTTNTPILPLSTYVLTIQNPQTTNTLLRINYHSGEVPPTPVVSNNPKLEQYLPHRTDSYNLTYDKKRNIYIFNFKIDPESDLSLATQYDTAKTSATRFIESKGVPINSITIEWKKH